MNSKHPVIPKDKAIKTFDFTQNLWDKSILDLHSDLKKIVEEGTKPTRFKCLICHKHNAQPAHDYIKHLPKHLKLPNHKTSMTKESLLSVNQEILDIIDPESSSKIQTNATNSSTTSRRVPTRIPNALENQSEIELKFEITQFLTSYRQPYSLASPLLEFIQNLMKKYEKNTILQSTISRTTASMIANQCISADLKDEIFESLKNSPFSLLIDEGSDPYGSAYLGVFAKFFPDDASSDPITKLISIIPIGEDATGATLYQMIKEKILDYSEEIPKNLMGIVTDQAGNMAGKYEGLAQQITNDYPHVVSFSDLCHIYNNISKLAVKAFPDFLITNLKKINSTFKHSWKSKAILRRLQLEKYVKPLEIVPYTEVRWLSLRDSIERLLELWPFLKAFFDENGDNEQKGYFSDVNEAYYRTFYTLLDDLVFYNAKFQSSNLDYEEVISDLKESFVIFTRKLLQRNYIRTSFENLLEFPWDEEEEISECLIDVRELQDAWLSNYRYPLFANLSQSTKTELFTAARNFILITIQQMNKRLPLRNPLLKKMNLVFLRDFDLEEWRNLAGQFPNVIQPDEMKHFLSQLSRMDANSDELLKERRNTRTPILEIWNSLRIKYEQIRRLSRAMMVLPYSSVPVERIFAQIQDFKTEKRNRLTIEHLENILLIQQAFGGTNFDVRKDMIRRYQVMWKENRKKTIVSEDVRPSPDLREREEEEKKEEKIVKSSVNSRNITTSVEEITSIIYDVLKKKSDEEKNSTLFKPEVSMIEEDAKESDDPNSIKEELSENVRREKKDQKDDFRIYRRLVTPRKIEEVSKNHSWREKALIDNRKIEEMDEEDSKQSPRWELRQHPSDVSNDDDDDIKNVQDSSDTSNDRDKDHSIHSDGLDEEDSNGGEIKNSSNSDEDGELESQEVQQKTETVNSGKKGKKKKKQKRKVPKRKASKSVDVKRRQKKAKVTH